jgi:glyoxylase-like metal-dependent hydrolase (beta-lactamase superfamily II)
MRLPYNFQAFAPIGSLPHKARLAKGIAATKIARMENFICVQCGTQFSETVEAPPSCPICEDERQFVRHEGQEWTTLKRLTTDHHNRLEEEAPRLLGIGSEPEFAIGQRALLLQSPAGNLLWDCITLLDDHTIAEVNSRGGIRAIAISHPHFYSSMFEWGERFDAEIFLHSADREWVMRPAAAGSRIQFWEGPTLSLWDGLTLINCGGHFEGGTVLHWPTGANGKGALLTSDIITVVQDRRWVSFMRSYPNLIPLAPAAINRILETIEPFQFKQIYGGWWGANILSDAKTTVRRSAERYLRAIASA